MLADKVAIDLVLKSLLGLKETFSGASISQSIKIPTLRLLHLAALLASSFIGQPLAACPAVGSNFYITAKLKGGQHQMSHFYSILVL